MIILQDTREQKPLKFNHEYITEVRKEKLDVGDYQARFANGKYSRLIFERKSIGDLFGTLTKGYTRFRKEIERAREGDVSLILCIEGSYTKIRQGYRHSKRKGTEICEQLRTIWAKYGVRFHFFNSREAMAKFIIDEFIWCGKKELWYEKVDI